MTDAEIGALARALITASGDEEDMSAILRSLPNPFPDGVRLIVNLAATAARLD